MHTAGRVTKKQDCLKRNSVNTIDELPKRSPRSMETPLGLAWCGLQMPFSLAWVMTRLWLQLSKAKLASANPVLQKFVWRPLIPCMQKPRQRASSAETGDRAGSCKAFVELWHHYDRILFLSLPISLDPLYKHIYIFLCV